MNWAKDVLDAELTHTGTLTCRIPVPPGEESGPYVAGLFEELPEEVRNLLVYDLRCYSDEGRAALGLAPRPAKVIYDAYARGRGD